MRKSILAMLILMSLVLTMCGPFTVSAEGEPYKFSLYGNLGLELKDSDIKLFEKLQEETNTIIDVQLPPSSNYDESLAIMMASMDYPDVVLFPDQNNKAFMDGVRDGVILPVNEYIANAPNLMQYTYDVSWKSLRVLGDENIYGIPRTSIARADGLLLRKDWVDNLGIDYVEEGKPLTLDQLTDILTRFVNDDPDGNGVNDTYGWCLTSTNGMIDVPSTIQWAHGLIGWQAYEGEDFEYMDLRYSKKSDNYKRALAYVNMLWENKLIDPDWPTVTWDVYKNRYDQGYMGIREEFAGWMMDSEAGMKLINPDVELAYIVNIVEKEGNPGQGGSFSTGFWGQWAIMASAKDPQKIVDVFDYMLSDDFWPQVMYGLEGVAWNYDEDGNRVAIPDNGYNAPRAILRRNNAPGFFVGVNVPVKDRARIENLIGVCIEQAVFSKDEGFRPAISDDPMYIDANNALRTAISKIIVGDLPLDAFDTELDKWYAGGGQTYIEQMNEGIKANQ